MAESTYTIFEVAAGTGMLGHGIIAALEAVGVGAVVVGGCERDACAASAWLAALEISQGSRPLLWDDVRTFLAGWSGRVEPVDIVCGGYPCQPFSVAGRKLGEADPRHLWPEVRRIYQALKPEFVFFENVDGHVRKGLLTVVRDLEADGYRVAWGVYSAEEAGAPHLRKRVFILGFMEKPLNGRARDSDREHSGRRGSPCVPQGDRTLSADGPVSADSGVGNSHRPQRHRNSSQRPEPEPRGDVSGSPSELAYHHQPRLESRRHPEPCGLGGSDVERGELPLFPPHRTDYAAWADLSAQGLDASLHPSIESGVSVVADGLAPPADLLRLGGNGVVPLTAAWAFLSLFTVLCVEGMEGQADLGPLFNRSLNDGGHMNHQECEFGHIQGITPFVYCCIKESCVGAHKSVGDCAACRAPELNTVNHGANNTRLMPEKKNPRGEKRCGKCEFIGKKGAMCCIKKERVKPADEACMAFEWALPATDINSHAYAREQLRRQK